MTSTNPSEMLVSPLTRRHLLRLGAGAVAGSAALRAVSTSTARPAQVPTIWETSSSGTVQATCVTDEAVYIATDTGQARALGVTDGAAIAETDLVQPVLSDGLAVAGKDLVVVTANARLHVLARDTLATRWKKPIAAGCRGVVAHGSLLTYAVVPEHSDDGELVTLNRETGAPKWRHSFDVYSRPFVIDDYIGIFGEWNSDEDRYTESSFVLFDRESGDVQWSTPLRFYPGYIEWSPSVVRAGDRLLLTLLDDDNSGVVALDLASGTHLWEAHFEETDPHGEILTDGSIAAIRSGNKLRTFSTVSGEIRWTSELTVNHGGLALADGTLFAAGEGAGGQSLLALNPASGVIRWEHSTGVSYERLVAAGGRLYAVEQDGGRVVAIPQSGSGPAVEESAAADESKGESDGRASFHLSGTNSTIPVGGTGSITLSAINLLDSKPMTVQLILGTPSGVSVTGVDGAEEGSNQYTATTTVPAGSETNINVHLQVNEPGTFSIRGRYVYTFGDSEVSRTREQVVTLVGKATDESTREGTVSSGDGPGFGVVSGLLGALSAGVIHWWRRE